MTGDATVFVVDDDDDVLRSMRFLIESIGLRVETFASAQQFLERYRPEMAGCLVLDVRMPGQSGLDLQDELRSLEANLPVIVITGYGDVPMAVRAMKAGAVEFLQKPVSDQLLLDRIQAVIARDQQRQRGQAEHRATAARLAELTPREREVLEHIVDGVATRDIATRLGVSPKTVESHRGKILKKMEARSVLDLVRMVLRLRASSADRGHGGAED